MILQLLSSVADELANFKQVLSVSYRWPIYYYYKILYIIAMTIEPITNTTELQQFCNGIKHSKFITIDTEFIREKTYYPQVCLIQVKGDGAEAAIDTLATGLDMTCFHDLLLDPGILKIFHASRQDLEIFFMMMSKVPAPLFDSQIAAMVCGLGDQIGYEALVKKTLNRQIDKTSRFTDWAARPLTQRQLDYAMGDVTHLYEIYIKLEAQLKSSNRHSWLDEEMAILENPATYRVEPKDAWLRLKARSGKPRFLSILQKVASWRESEAQARDVPRNRIIRDESIFDIAGSQPKNIKDLSRIRGISDKMAQGKMGDGILKAVNIALNLTESELPKEKVKYIPPQGIGPLRDLLRVLLKLQCEKFGVATRLIANGDDLEKIAADNMADVPALKGWRREIFGDMAMDLKNGNIALAVNGKEINIIKLNQRED